MTASDALVGLLAAVALTGLTGPWRRWGGSGSARIRPAERRPPPLRLVPRWQVPQPGRDREPDVAQVVTEVAARLRAGATVTEAWWRATRRGEQSDAESDQAPGADTALAWVRGASARTRDPRVRAQLAAVAAACRLADRLGCPLADVLERSAAGVVEVAQAEQALRIAFAGPVSTARLLAWLPAAGIVLGWALGVDPSAGLLDGGLGTAAGVLGVLLAVLGRRWSRALVDRARRAPHDTGRFRTESAARATAPVRGRAP